MSNMFLFVHRRHIIRTKESFLKDIVKPASFDLLNKYGNTGLQITDLGQAHEEVTGGSLKGE